jgi:phosphotransferase system HPr-like phosphotransfer protein
VHGQQLEASTNRLSYGDDIREKENTAARGEQPCTSGNTRHPALTGSAYKQPGGRADGIPVTRDAGIHSRDAADLAIHAVGLQAAATEWYSRVSVGKPTAANMYVQLVETAWPQGAPMPLPATQLTLLCFFSSTV